MEEYGKIIDGHLCKGSIPTERGGVILNPRIDQYVSYGYKPLIYQEYPDTSENQIVDEIYEETDSEIKIKYEVKNI